MESTITKYVIDKNGNARTFLSGLGEERDDFRRDAKTTEDIQEAYKADTAEQAALVMNLVKLTVGEDEKAARPWSPLNAGNCEK